MTGVDLGEVALGVMVLSDVVVVGDEPVSTNVDSPLVVLEDGVDDIALSAVVVGDRALMRCVDVRRTIKVVMGECCMFGVFCTRG